MNLTPLRSNPVYVKMRGYATILIMAFHGERANELSANFLLEYPVVSMSMASCVNEK